MPHMDFDADLVDYLTRMQARPQVKAAIDHEMALRKTVVV